LTNGTLPSVAYIDPGFTSGLDEHPGLDDNVPGASIQRGSQYVSTLIDALMQSSSWQDSVFILTFDEFGGFYDHVAPQPTVSPDGIKPIDLLPGPPPNGPDICVLNSGPTCDFVYTGYRVPLMVISPFAKKNFVSHTVADYTAWLKLVETRFSLPSLTKRDAAQPDMTEFFDFVNVPWATPPTPPKQPTNGACYLTKLP
jgi:phospholipase C